MWQTEINNYGSFLVLLTPPLPLKTQKIRILKKWKKLLKYHFTLVYQKPQSYEVQFLRYRVRQTNMLSFWAIFCPLTPLITQRMGDVIILHMCTKNHDHMMYASWDMECNSYNFLPFYPTIDPLKIKIWKKCKNTWRYYLLSYVYHKSRSYEVWFLRYKAQRT